MIEKRQEKGWEFIFLGANIDAAAEAGRMGIKAGRAVTYTCDAQGTALNYAVLNDTIGKMRKASSVEAMACVLDEGQCFNAIEKDNAQRKHA